MTGERLWVGLLGPFEARRADQVVAVPAGRPRALLATLALSAGRTVAVDVLAELVWAEEVPRDPRSAVQNNVMRLRRLLGPDAIRSDAGGYRLAVERDQVDTTWFADLVAAARQADGGRRREFLDQALELWRGDPLTGVGAGLLERAHRDALAELRVTAIELRIDAATGDPSGWIPELERLTTQFPLRESLWERLIHVLKRSGRPAEALAAYERLRVLLADQLGSPPSIALQQLHRQLLSTPDPVPRQLPDRPRWFVGREDELKELDALRTGGAQVLVLHGPGGTGKTSLGLVWARRSMAAFPDGQVYCDLRGYGPDEALDPTYVLGVILRAFGADDAKLPLGLDERSALLRTRLAGRRALIFLDNARDVRQVRPLLPGGDSVVLVTSRNHFRGLAVREGAGRCPVGLLAPDRAAELLAEVTGRAGPDLQDVVELCGRLPLALMIAAQRIAQSEFDPVDARTLAGELRRTRFEALSDPADPESDLRAVLSWSYDALDADDARFFRLLGVLPSPTVGVGAAAAIAALPDEVAQRRLECLAAGHLVQPIGRARYRLHDLVWLLAIERCADDPERADAGDRLIDWYTGAAVRGAEVAFGVRPAAAPASRVRTPEFADLPAAMRWFLDEEEVLGAVAVLAARAGRERTALQLIGAVANFQLAKGRLPERLRLAELSAELAETLDDDNERCRAGLRLLGTWHRLNEHEKGLSCVEPALAAAERCGDHGTASTILITAGLLLAEVGRFDEALRSAARGVNVAEAAENPLRLAHAVTGLTHVRWLAGRLPEAAESAQRALELLREHGAPYHLALALGNQSDILVALGEPRPALAAAEEALELLTGIGDSLSRPNALIAKGRALLALGDADAARAVLTEARELLGPEAARSEEVDKLLTSAADRAAGPG